MKLNIRTIKLIFKNNKKLSAGVCLYTIFFAALAPIQMIAVQMLVDHLLAGETQKLLLIDTAFLTLIHFMSAGREPIMDLLRIKIEKEIMCCVMPEFLNKESRLSYDTLQHPETQNLLNRLSDTPYIKMRDNLMDWIKMAGGCLSLAGFILYLCRISKFMAFSSLFLCSALVWANFKSISTINQVIRDQTGMARECNYFGRLLSEKNSLGELRLFAAVKELLARYESFVSSLYRERLHKTLQGQKWLAVGYVFNSLWIGFAILWSVRLFQIGEVSYGMQVAWLGAAFQMLGMTDSLSMTWGRLFFVSAELMYYEEFLRLPEEERTGSIPLDEIGPDFEIRLEEVSYTYPGNREKAIDHLSMAFHSGERIALAGENGSGKSTLVKLICGFLKPDEGRITINQEPVCQLKDSEKKSMISAAFQTITEYPFSIRENIILGNFEQRENKERLSEVMQLLGLDEKSLDLDRELGKYSEGGTELSNGQLQSLLLARALFSSAKFLILDEPTASLDSLTESRIYENIMKMSEKRGLMIISHRMSSARLMDRILVLKNGRIVEQGPHDKLIKRNGVYAEMYSKQAKWYQEQENEKD